MLAGLIKNKIQYRYRRSLPDVVYNSDLFIVEFPKSGITWFSTILANLYRIKDPSNKLPTLFNLEQIIGDVHQTKNIQIPNTFPNHRTIKSHAEFNPYYRNVVYLIRNPYSVMESYYNYLSGQGKIDVSISEFVQGSKYGVNAWVRHVESWLHPVKEPNFHLLKYESLIDNPAEEIGSLVNNLGMGFSSEEIAQAVSLSSFENMKKDNELYNRTAPFRKYNFVRRGAGRSVIEGEVKQYIFERTKHLLKELYPDDYGLE